MKNGKLSRGFTIIDAVLAAAIFLITVTSIVRVLTIANNQLAHQRHMTQAISISENVIEELLLAYGETSVISVGSHGPRCYGRNGSAVNCTNAQYKAYWQVASGTPLAGMTQITVRTRWKERGKNRETKFVTVRN